jgi:hypothetical protein
MRECKKLGYCPFEDHNDCTCFKETQIRFWETSASILIVLEIVTLAMLLYIGWR